ncbi:MAG: Rid family detoxifying hydrolase [Thermoplasmatota archaeon]
MTMEKKWIKEIVETGEAPAAVGPYSQAVAAGPLIFVSGQIGLVPGTKRLAGDTIEEQTRQAMENIAAILDAAGSSLDLVLKMTVTLRDIRDFPRFNEVYGRFFEDGPPARAAYESSGLPLSALVEIETVALRD